ncbi:MAG: Glycosyl transferases group 1 [Bacteroidetes bacterium ADurb.Bin174]|nr:MAG: Glycosyl transferases group 1 [Bacteroidetes bacterium ADurb.Bin174]
MQKICHLTSIHQRFDGRIFRKECKCLQSAGYDVSLIVADGKGDQVVDNISIHDVGIEVDRVSRFINTTNKIKKRAIQLNCDIYHFHDPDLIFVGLKLKSLGKKVIFDMHENIPVDIEEKEYIHPHFRKLLSYLYEKLEIYAVKKFDGVVSTRESINERLKAYNSNIELVTNFPVVDKIIEKEKNNAPTISFAGAVVPQWRHKEIINAIENIDNVQYQLAGPAGDRFLNELKNLKGWRKVNYVGKVPFDQVKEMYKKETIGVAIYVYCKNMDGMTGNLANTKLFEYMNWEIPIVCTDFSLWKKIVVDELQCGICVNPYDVNAISKAITYLLENPDIARQMGKNGRKAVLNTYNWDTQAQKLLTLYNKITNT